MVQNWFFSGHQVAQLECRAAAHAWTTWSSAWGRWSCVLLMFCWKPDFSAQMVGFIHGNSVSRVEHYISIQLLLGSSIVLDIFFWTPPLYNHLNHWNHLQICIYKYVTICNICLFHSYVAIPRKDPHHQTLQITARMKAQEAQDPKPTLFQGVQRLICFYLGAK